jgi:hypothetical protein
VCQVRGVPEVADEAEHAAAAGVGPSSPDGRIVRTIGIARAKAKIGLQNLAYNIRRLVTLERMVEPLRFVPVAALGAVLIFSAFSLFDVGTLREIWKYDRLEVGLSLMTTLGVVAVGTINGILIAVALALVFPGRIGAGIVTAAFGLLTYRVELTCPRRHLRQFGNVCCVAFERPLQVLDEGADLQRHRLCFAIDRNPKRRCRCCRRFGTRRSPSTATASGRDARRIKR